MNPDKFLIPCALQELDRTSALADSGASINLLPHSIYKAYLGLDSFAHTRMHFVLAHVHYHPMVPYYFRKTFPSPTAKALIDLYEEKLTLRVGKEELVYYADKSEKNKKKKFVHAISIIDFSKDDPFCGSTTIPSDALFPSSSPMKTSNSTFEKFIDEFTLPNSLPSGNDIANVNPLFDGTIKDFEISLSPSFTSYFIGKTSIQTGYTVYYAIHDKNLVTLEENSKENISSGTLLFLKEPSSLRPPLEPPDVCMRFKPILAMKDDFVKPNEDFYLREMVLSLNVEDVDSFLIYHLDFSAIFHYKNPPENSPLIFSLGSENFVLEPGIITFLSRFGIFNDIFLV
ncbi:reverse transcriptase domain-containing protein [Tanacetum coccineum]